jgi:hypothetical protein
VTGITACLATISTLVEDAAVRSIPGTVLAGLALSASVLLGGAVSAADVTVQGSVSGELTPKARATFRVTAEHSDGWQALRRLAIIMELHGALLEEIAYDVDDSFIEVGGSRALTGTGDVATGGFFEVAAFEVEVTAGGDRLGLRIAATTLQSPPPGARFRFIAETDEGEEATTSVAAVVEEEDEGLSALTIGGAVVAALVAGGFLGSRLTGHRRPGASVYDSVARRLREDERPPPRPGRP